MRIGSIVLVIWLVIGAIAAGQRGYYNSLPSCAGAGTVIVSWPGRSTTPGPTPKCPAIDV